MKVELTINIENSKGIITPENIHNILTYINEEILQSHIKDDNEFHPFKSITRNQPNLENIVFSAKCV